MNITNHEKHRSNISILYAEYDESNYFNQAVFKSFFTQVHSSNGLEDTLNKFHNFKDINNTYFDVVILDNRLGLDICNKLRNTNKSQQIIIQIGLDNNKNLSDFYINGFDNFLYEPLSKASIEKSIYSAAEKIEYLNQLTRAKEEQNKEITGIVSKYENKLHDSERKLEERSSFFASMSHEIRTPMNAIIGLSQVLTEDKSLNKNQLETAKTINRSSNMLLEIINDILDFSKMEAGKLSLEKTSFDLNMILSYVADMTSLKAKEKGIYLTFDINHNIGKNYLGDSLRISQILLNLVSNAIKFTQKGGVILSIRTIDLDNGKSTIEFEVKDTGIGLSEEALLKLFQNYTQASDDTSRKYGGTGLGLTITKQLVELMRGKIWVDSVEGEGSSFFVNIKLDTDKEKRNYRLPSRDIMNMQVMIIDSDLNSRESLTNLIEYFRMPVKGSSNLDEAIRLLNEDKYDILFVDKYMYKSIDVNKYKLNKKCHVILIDDWKNILNNDGTDYDVVDEVLKKPFQQQMIFEILSRLYSINGIQNSELTQVDKFNKEDLLALGEHTILVAEDNLINQKVMSGLLSGTNLKLIFADDGQKALDALKENPQKYELIFMDINMPNLDGYMATQIIRQNTLYDNISIIGLSGHSSEEDLKKAKDVGMQDYIVKPIDVEILHSMLIKHIKNN